MRYAKAIVATVGAVLVALLEVVGPLVGMFPAESTIGRWLTVIVLVGTALGVYRVPNAPPVRRPADGAVRRTY